MRLNKSGPPYTTWPDKHSGPLGLCELVESGPLSLERAKDAIRQKLRASSGEGDTIGDRIQAKIAPYERIQPGGGVEEGRRHGGRCSPREDQQRKKSSSLIAGEEETVGAILFPQIFLQHSLV